MSKRIVVIRNVTVRWQKHLIKVGEESIECWVTGFAWINGRCLESDTLAIYLAAVFLHQNNAKKALLDRARNAFESMNGTFAFVLVGENRILAAVDHIRSTPLFYGVRRGRFIISNEARQVREFVSNDNKDNLATIEFLLSGYVTGSDTLYPNVKQLQAGELLISESTNKGNSIITDRYFRYLHGNYFSSSTQRLHTLFKETLINILERTLTSIQGRQIVLPLSGGLDSRLLAAMLRHLGIDRVLCFSYGKPGCWESKVSEYTANKLGYRWVFVPYSREKWAEWFYSDARKDYFREADGLTSIPHLQDWPAIGILKELELLDPSAVFLPGHTLDFLAGGHIPTSFAQADEVGEEALIESILDKHYSLWTLCNRSEKLILDLKRRVSDRIVHAEFVVPERATSAFESWEWQERQAKWIVNSVRVYEYWGFEWRLPYWDREMLQFWSKMNFGQRLGRKFQKSFALHAFPDLFTRSYQEFSAAPKSLRSRLQNTPVHDTYKLISQILPGLRAYSGIMDYWSDYIGWYGIHSWVKHLALRNTKISIDDDSLAIMAPTNINSYLVFEYLLGSLNEIY